MTPVLMIPDEELIKSITIKNFDYFQQQTRTNRQLLQQ